MILCAFAAALAADEGVRAWETLYDAQLIETVDGTPSVAWKYYEQLLDEVPESDPLRGQVWLALGRAGWDSGRPKEAEYALREALRYPGARREAESFLARIEMETRRVRQLPSRLGFEGGTGGFVRAPENADRGALEVRPEDGNPALAWNTEVRSGAPDRVALALHPGLPLRGLSLRVRAHQAPARLLLRVGDGVGGVWGEAEVTASPGGWTRVELLPGRGAARVTPRLFEVLDVSGLRGAEGGENTIVLDDVELR